MTGIWTAPPSAEANLRRRRAAGTTLLAGSLVVAGAMLVPSILPFGQAEAEEGVTVHRQPITALQVFADTGSLTVIPSDGDATEVAVRSRWDGEQPTVSQDRSGTTLTIVADCTGSGSCEVDLTVSVPPGVAVTGRTDTGDVRVSGLVGEVEIITVTGDLELAGLSGRVRAGTDNGDVTGEDLRSPWITTTTGTGDVSLSFDAAPDMVSAVVGTGDLEMEVPESSDGYRVDAATGTGELEVRMAQNPNAFRSILARVETGDVALDTG